MKLCESLKPGDIVELIAPACLLNHAADVEQACALLKSWGLVPRCHEPLYATNTDTLPFVEADDETRFNALKAALYAEDSRMIWCVRGGYGSARLLSKLATLTPPKASKCLIGFSDITALHLFLTQQWGWQTIHGEMLSRWVSPELQDKLNPLRQVILGKRIVEYTGLIPLNNYPEKPMEGICVAGNLSLIQASIGTAWEIQTNNKIVIIEEIAEKAYRIDRILTHLKQAGVFQSPLAVIFGDMLYGSDEKESHLISKVLRLFGESANFPVFHLPGVMGHGECNDPIPVGGVGKIVENRLVCEF